MNALQDSDQQMDKAKARLDSTTEELERVLVAKEGENYRDANLRTDALPSSNNKRGIGKALNKGLFKGKNPAQMQKHEDEVRQRMTSASEAYRKAAIENQTLRKEYYDKQLPKVVRVSSIVLSQKLTMQALKECADELDNGMQYHLARYAFIYESTVGSEASTLIGSPDDGPGLKAIYERIDNRSDFKAYMQNYVVAVKNQSWVPRRDGLDEVSTQAQQPLPQTPQVQVQQQQSSTPAPPPSLPNLSTNGNGIANTHAQHQQQHQQPSQQPPQQQQNLQPQPPMPMGDSYTPSPIAAITGATFGVDLGDQLVRDNAEVPKVVVNCAEAIEEYGLDSMGIYRLSGTTSKVQALKNALDKDIDAVNIMDEQWSGDINVVSSALKLWFRELPEPLLTYGLYHGFVDAARYENDRLRHIRLHEQVNELPDPNYATLKYFMGHLDKIRRKEGVNQMSASNLSIVFGPTLLGAPPEEGGLNLEHMNYQCKVS